MTKEKEEKDLIKKDPSALAEQFKPAPGTEAIGQEDITLPRLRLLQGTSAEVKNQESKPGRFKHSLTEEFFDAVEFIPISMFKSRVMFDADNREGAPLCRSVDFKTGSDGTVCSDCDNAKWQEGKPPICSTTWNYLVFFPDQVEKMIMPTILSIMKSSSQAALKLNTSVEFTIPKQPFWHFVWKLTTKEKPFPKGKAFIIQVQQARETTEKERAWAQMIYKNTIGKKIAVEEEALDELE